MNQNETLYRNYIILQNKINRLKGKEILDESEDYFNSTDFKDSAESMRAEDLEKCIAYLSVSYEVALYNLRVEEFYNTDQGKAKKETYDKAISDLCEKRKECSATFDKKLNGYIKSWLGDNWAGRRGGRGNIDIGIVANNVDNHTNPYFEYSFTLVNDISFPS